MKVGQLVADRYEIEELAGAGGMASVYRARDRLLERRVALKVLHQKYSQDPEYVERFRREARAIARLSHPNIVTVIDRGEFEGSQYIVFEYVAGENLKDLVEREGALPVRMALELTRQVARGLAFAHQHGVVHRDVKPHNVLIDREGIAKVTDFGIARSLDRDEGLTLTGTLMGTSDYLAPEQAAGRPVGERSDQYSLGVLLYELLTGRVPFPAENLVTAAVRHLNDPVPSVRALRSDVSPGVEALVARAMAKEPEGRFQSTDGLIVALEACLAEETVPSAGGDGATEIVAPARPEPRARRERPRRRRPLVPFFLGLVVVLAGLGLLFGFVVRQGDTDLPFVGGGGQGAEGGVVRLQAVADFDPQGDRTEHPEAVPRATDDDLASFWTTETYGDFEGTKDGVGIVLRPRESRALAAVTVRSDTPGFTARIQAGNRRGGDFEDVSEERQVGRRTTFDLDTDEKFRFYVVWITRLDSVAHVNEVRGRS